MRQEIDHGLRRTTHRKRRLTGRRLPISGIWGRHTVGTPENSPAKIRSLPKKGGPLRRLAVSSILIV